ncbi:alpha-D-ribose 1-methylphosphonate 5-triphosphate diphosphatase [Chelatococcus sp. XZ-Ab1]|uniref:alpha-D-ribose 1-methylphosphonate 5-triphosphate diphosphatase n=1 Tax=Chelatococcus sp. XZ-Ab1 TaxID=3034027 RepID=UPI0023E43085|nr:alpha-D-ribose 1-methylphosphonate 5-triphosphate diphosphatase [Chelatococcus sp. XZ-Ab1]
MTATPDSFVIENATLILPDRIVPGGWLAVSDGRIAEFGEGRAPERGIDLAGDYLLPGLVELHTDHLESHYAPRPKVRWHPLAAVMAYDAQIAAAGITTVFDSLRIGSDFDKGSLGEEVWALADAIKTAVAEGHVRAEHRTHLRCEISSPDVIDQAERYVAEYPVHMMSLMDHTPGQRQFRDIAVWKTYYSGKNGVGDDAMNELIARRLAMHEANAETHRRRLVEIARARGVVLASHDDATPEHVEEAKTDGVAIAEFPTTIEAARGSHAAGIRVMMGGPNIVRGGSHSGSVAAEAVAREGVLDIISSDYVPASLLMAAFDLPRRVPAISLPEAVATVTRNPALATGLADRGALAAGLRADLVCVHMTGAVPVVRQVWREGRRVA